jgi:trimethylamine--corrinoid protein Co-methyltransferase
VSIEKLLLDNEICGMAKRLVTGIGVSPDTLAVELIKESGLGYSSEGYVGAEHTRSWLKSEIFMTSEVIDRSTRREFEETGERDARQRAEDRIEEIFSDREPRAFDPAKKKELDAIMLRHAQKYGMHKLPAGI